MQLWDEFTQDLYALWQGRSFSWELEDPSAIFLTWYLAPGYERRACLYGKRVTLFGNFWDWKRQLRAAWTNELQPDAEVYYHLVMPPPASLEPGIAGHLILVQSPLDDLAAALFPLLTMRFMLDTRLSKPMPSLSVQLDLISWPLLDMPLTVRILHSMHLLQRSAALAKTPTLQLDLCSALEPRDSLTDEFLQAIRANEQAQAQDPALPDPFSLEDLQVVIIQQAVPERASIVLSVYDSDPEVDPIRTFCLTVASRLSMDSLLEVLQMTSDCPPVTVVNECLLWYGTIPIHGHRQVNLRHGNALRLVIRRGLPLDIPTLLSMPDHRLRQELQDAIGGTIYRRPRGPAFRSAVSAMPDLDRLVLSTQSSPSDLRPSWLIALSDVFHQRAFTEMQEEGPVCYVLTWFLHGDRYHRCPDPRVVRLTRLSFQWRHDLVMSWRDQLQRDEPVDFWVVHPTPPRSPLESHVAHVILTQQLPSTQQAVLLTAVIQDPQEALLEHTAYILPAQVPLAELHHLIVPAFVRQRPTRARLAEQLLTVDQAVELHSGDSVVFEVLGLSLVQPSSSDAAMPGMHLLQRSVKLRHKSVPSEPVVIQVWFLTHQTVSPQAPFRQTAIPNWDCLLDAATQLWSDVLLSTENLTIWPIQGNQPSDQRFVPVQGERPDQYPVLISSVVHDDQEVCIEHRVKWCPSHVDQLQVFALALLPEDVPSQSVQCSVHDVPLLAGMSVQIHPGSFICIRINHVRLASRHLTVDFRDVFQVHQWLDTHLFLPRYDLPDTLPFQPASRSWIDAQWWTPGTPGSEVRIYYDGSKIHQDGSSAAGAAVAAFVLTDLGWTFAGALSTALTAQTSSYTAELSASLLASKFAYDLAKLLTLSCKTALSVTFCFDSLTVGRQSEGTWQACVSKQMHQVIRSLHQWISIAFPVEFFYQHVKAHRGEPGNELVDCLALAAAQGSPLHDLQAWLEYVTKTSFAAATDWLWFLHRSDLSWQGTDLCFPCAAQTLPTTSVLPAIPCDDAVDTPAPTGALDLLLATCNVLSLCPNRQDVPAATGLSGPARQDALLSQFHEAGMHIFAFQETRLKKLYAVHDHRFWLFRSPATPQGHYGIIVGFSRLHPIGQICNSQGAPRDVCFDESHFSVIATDPRYLLLRVHNALIKCILIAAHGPHRGYSIEAIDQWWSALGDAIPAQYALWDRILLTDASGSPCTPLF
eukprot:s4354_g3.t1